MGTQNFFHIASTTRTGNTPAVMAYPSVWWCQGWQLVCVCSVVCLVVPTCPETGGVQIEAGRTPGSSSRILMPSSHPPPPPLLPVSLPEQERPRLRSLPALVGTHRTQRGTKELQQPVLRCMICFTWSRTCALHGGREAGGVGGWGEAVDHCESSALLKSEVICSHTGNFAAFISWVFF